MFAKVLLGILAFCAVMFGVAGIVVYQSGILIVDVNDKVAGHHVYLPVPMLLADVGLTLMPSSSYQDLQRELGPHREVLKALSRELANCPDSTFVEVQTRQENVKIAKEGDDLIVNVVSPDANVHIEVPLSSTERIFSKLTN